MATSTQSKQQRLSIQMREILGDAYGFVRGAQYNKTAANITYEQLLDDAINRIEVLKVGQKSDQPSWRG